MVQEMKAYLCVCIYTRFDMLEICNEPHDSYWLFRTNEHLQVLQVVHGIKRVEVVGLDDFLSASLPSIAVYPPPRPVARMLLVRTMCVGLIYGL